MSKILQKSRLAYRLCTLGAVLLLGLSLLTPVPEAQAALVRKDSASLKDACNPNPSNDDVILPMPGGLSMAFRVTAVPANGFLWDLPLRPGREDIGDDRVFYDRSYRSGLSAPFSANDVPASWKANLPKGKYFFYLTAKYEVSRLQWKAIMEPEADLTKVTPDDLKPITNISWFDAMVFTEKYTTWLLENHPEQLPSFKSDTRNTGFVRLPTEIEWEYAARGAHKVPTSDLRQENFFRLEDNTSLRDYAVFRETGSSHGPDSLAKIGSRKPNPLGLYDTAGNAAEMTLDTFRFSVAGRLLGSAGGFVRKGGSFVSAEDEIMPGRREEIAPFLKKGVQRTTDTGFRVVVSGINTPGGNRIAELSKEYSLAAASPTTPDPAPVPTATAEVKEETKSAQGSGLFVPFMGESSAPVTAAKTPMAELERLIASAQDDGVRKNLMNIRASLRESNVIHDRVKQTEVEAHLQNCVMSLESVRHYEYRLLIQRNNLKRATDLSKKATKTEDKNRIKKILDGTKQDIKDTEETVQTTLNIYRTLMLDISEEEKRHVLAALESLEHRYRGKDQYNRRMTLDLDIVKSHYQKLSKGNKLSSKQIYGDIQKAVTQPSK